MLWRAILGAAVAAALVFVWGFVYWTMLPYPERVMQSVASEATLVEALQAALPASGMYAIPGRHGNDAAAMADQQQRTAKGPVAILAYRNAGVEMTGPYFAFGYLQMFLAALAAAIALSACDVNFYPGRVMIVFWMGIFAALWAHLSNVAWFHHPVNYFWLQLGYTVPAAFVMGIVLAAFVRPPSARRADDQ
jgi:hypothetical protein